MMQSAVRRRRGQRGMSPRILAATATALCWAGVVGVAPPRTEQERFLQAADDAFALPQLTLATNSWMEKERARPHATPRPSDEYLQRNMDYSMRARREIPAAAHVPDHLFLEYVLPYRQLDEPLDDWRAVFFESLKPHAAKAKNLTELVEIVVPRTFTGLGNTVEFKPDCTPSVMAPLTETLKVGHASCTGCSILLADALRSVGVPARVVGTPEWNLPTGGNHNWVEVWTGEGTQDGWHFFDAAPATSVDWDKGWFVPGNTEKAQIGSFHGIYTPVWDYDSAQTNYTLTWREPFGYVPAIERTAFYKHLSTPPCPTCPYTGLPLK